MSILEAIVLGIVQGFTEFLPVSSTAHLRVVPAVAGWEDPGTAFTAVTQLGTLAAVVAYFRHELLGVARSWTGSVIGREDADPAEARLGWYLIIGTVPIVVFGAAFTDLVERGTRDLTLIAAMLIVFGFALGAADRWGARSRGLDGITPLRALGVGLGQAAALIPGVSRAGGTITAALALGFDRVTAARYSFLLAVPAIGLSGGYELLRLVQGRAPGEGGAVPLLVATLVAFAVAYVTIDWLLRFLTRHSTGVFVVYRIALGVLLLALLGAGLVE